MKYVWIIMKAPWNYPFAKQQQKSIAIMKNSVHLFYHCVPTKGIFD